MKPGVDRARRLRREMSPAEICLWAQLRGQQLGVKFRKGHPVGPYIADFYCCSASLAIEVDGGMHDRGDAPTYDEGRNSFFRENGHDVLRIPAREVFQNLEGVLTAISARVASPLHHASHGPPPRFGEE